METAQNGGVRSSASRGVRGRLVLTSSRDPVSGLPSQLELERFLNERAIAHDAFGLLVVSIPSLERINHTLGHHIGDLVSSTVGRRLLEAHPDSVVAPLSGGHFGVALPNVRSLPELRAALLVTSASMEKDVRIGVASLHITLRTGAALAAPGTTALGALTDAESALSRARRRGLDGLVFNPSFSKDTEWSLMLSGQLRSALRSDQITLHYQPQFDLRTSAPVAVEGLARWAHPEHGLLWPDAFLDVIELSGLTEQFTLRMMRHGVDTAARLEAAGYPLRVAVNAPMTVIRAGNVIPALAQMCAESGVPANRMMVEITETAFDDPTVDPTSLVADMRAAGFGVSLDDFGAGYSSLTRLAGLSVTELKIDRALICPLGLPGTKDHRIVRSIIDMAHLLDLWVVAEGVEHEEQERALAAMGCDYGQGYRFARPMPVSDLLDRLGEWKATRPSSEFARPARSANGLG